MNPVAPRAVALALLLSSLPTVAAPAATPPPKADTATPETSAALRDQLVTSLRADISALKRAKQPDIAGVERLTQAIDGLNREADLADGRRGPGAGMQGSAYAEQRGTAYSWSAIVQAQGSEKSAALAVRLQALLQRERAAAEMALLERAEAVGKRAGTAALQAKTAQEIDPLLAEIAEIVTPYHAGRYSGSGGGSTFQQLAAVSQFVASWQNFLVLAEAGRSAEALQALRNVNSSGREVPWIPRSKLTRQLADASRRAGKPSPEELTAQLTALAEKALAAETPEALDPLLVTARKLQTLLQNEESGQRISTYITFLERWQDFHLARAAGHATKLRESLNQLKNYELRQLDLPRSVLLEKIYALSGSAGDDDGGTARSTRTKPVASEKLEKPDAVLARMQKLEDIAPHQAALHQAATLESGQSSPSSAWQSALAELNSIQREYQQLSSGLAVRVTLGFSHVPNLPPQIAALRQQLACFAIQRLVGDEAKLAPAAGENSLTYLRRVLAAARAAADWRLVQRTLEMGQSTGVQDPLLKTSDSTALTSFLAGMTQERARQFSLAVISYQAALKTGSDLLPVDDLAERLARIKKEQPADYEQGVLWTVTPPQMRDPYGRPVIPDMMRPNYPPQATERPGEKPVLVPEKKTAPEPPKPAEAKP